MKGLKSITKPVVNNPVVMESRKELIMAVTRAMDALTAVDKELHYRGPNPYAHMVMGCAKEVSEVCMDALEIVCAIRNRLQDL